MKNCLHVFARCLLLTTVILGGFQLASFAQVYATASPLPLQRSTSNAPSLQSEKSKRSVRTILFALEESYHVSFSYNDAIVRELTLKENFTWDKNEKLEAVLRRLVDEANLKFEKIASDNYLILQEKKSADEKDDVESALLVPPADMTPLKMLPAEQQQRAPIVRDLERQVSGLVKDDTDSPLPGVNVVVKGTTTGTTTDSDGRYVLSLPDGENILVFSFIGYAVQEVAVNNETNIDITLLPDLATLQEVVVVGYGEQKRANVLGAVTSVQPQDIEDNPSANLSTLLRGRMAGVGIGQTSGKPGASTSIRIRKEGTWNATNPIFVIDGFIYPDQEAFDLLDPTEVESISVLKDASAAVYGARAANGVILVKTKRGKVGKPKISYSGSIGISSPTEIPDMLNAYDHATMINDGLKTLYQTKAGTLENDPNYFSPDELEHFKTHNYNWMDEAWKSSSLMRHTLNISGGSDKIKYFVSGTYYNETGNFDQLYAKKYTLRANIEADITKDLKATWLLSNNYREDERPYYKADQADPMNETFKTLLQMPQWLPPYINDRPVGNNVLWHPMALINGGSYLRNKDNGINMNFGLEYKVPVVEGLSLKVQYGRSNNNAFGKQYLQPYTLYNFGTTGGKNHILTDQVASTTTIKNNDRLYQAYAADVRYQLNAVISYARVFGSHDLSAMLIYEQAENSGDDFYAQRENMLPGGVDQLFAGSADAKEAYGSGSEGGRLSYLGRLNYSYADKYLLEASFRYEGSTKFAPPARWGLFPSVAAGWRVSEESFFADNVRFVSQLKLRGSVGLLGFDGIGENEYRWLQSYSYQAGKGALFGGSSLGTGMQPKTLPNYNGTWEKRLSYNYGFDASFLDNRINLSVDAYYRNAYDILNQRENAIPTTVGASLTLENYGKMTSRGMDIELGYNGRITGEWKYYLSGNASWGKNKVVQKFQSPGAIGTWVDEIGKPTGAIVGYYATGIIRTQAELDQILAANPDYTIFEEVPQLGMMNYRDIRGADYSEGPDGKIDDNDKDNIRYSNPVSVGFSLGTSWKGLRIDLNFNGAIGGYDMVDKEVYKQVALTTTHADWKNQPVSPVQSTVAMWKDHWTPENPDASMPRVYDNMASEASTFWLRSGTVIRLNNVNVSYVVPKTFISKLGMDQVRVFFSGANLWLLTDDIKYKDPSISLYNGYPLMKTYTFGLNLTL